MDELRGLSVPYICRQREGSVIDMDDQDGGLGVNRTMTSTLRPGSVTAHVLRNDVLQQHIDVSRKSGDALCLFLDWCRPGPEN
jgi:hypothetical protein